jgi:hypothetical protein
MLKHVERGTQRLVQKLGLSSHLAMLDRAWESELGGLAKVVRVVALDRSMLVVEADSSPAMQEISLRRKELVRRLNKHFGETFIEQIMVKVASNG